ncbi:hypothetical protein EUX98_g8236 [Antrodiella citrinella]|uniref:Uncharacterized protein n=1 Tax=Antrodiella citrinella TaxID=2447956 RepID=A0A4S4MC46_9APHY|nr:hypothetical protein EUX98_g8236 [Antrodiella citrinella]
MPPGLNGHAGRADAASSKTSNHERVQVIDDEKQFTTELTSQIQHWGLRDVGFDYDIVAVFGSQSTGKSTLLNRLFGTSFDVMDEARRQQTTKGIWMCKGKDMNVMVMDVEGTDGRERGEDQDFERKSALFSLASSEVLLVNMWEHQVGLYNGANMGLLKTVFEVNLGIFGKSANQRTLLLFVIRDHTGHTPLANLQATLAADMQRLWDSISKPPELQDRQLSDYFDLDFATLPHKILVPEKFEAEIQQLRKRFSDKSRSDCVFKPAYHKGIPADGVAFYMEGVWEQVQSNKDLDLPTQQELLAQFRCDEIATAALSEFNEQAKPQRRPIEAGKVVDGLGGMMRAWRSGALTRYDRDASRYHKGVYKRKRDDLLAVLDSTLSPLFQGQLKNLAKQSLVAFKRDILNGLKGDSYDFAEIVGAARKKCEASFLEGAKEALVEDTDWSYEEDASLLSEEVQLVADQCRKDETKKMVNVIERNFKRQVAEPVEVYLGKAAPTMWDDILKTFKSTLAKAESSYLSKAQSFNCTEEENTTALASIRKRTWVVLRAKIDEQTSDTAFLTKLRSHFEERFRYDEAGVPRVWRPEDDIDGAFKKAKDETLDLIPRYSKIKPVDPANNYTIDSGSVDLASGDDEFDFASTLIIFTDIKAIDLSNRFRKDADAYYVEAKRSTVSSVAQIPLWVYGMFVLLGWNEAMAVLFNPLRVPAVKASPSISPPPLPQLNQVIMTDVDTSYILSVSEESVTDTEVTELHSDPFADEDADVVLQSADKFYFHAHKLILRKASPFFVDLLDLPQDKHLNDDESQYDGKPVIPFFQESSSTLLALLMYIYPGEDPHMDNLTDVSDVLRAAEKHDLDFIATKVRERWMEMAAKDPLRAYAIACLKKWPKQAHAAAEFALEKQVWPLEPPLCVEYDQISGNTVLNLEKYHRTCARVAQNLARDRAQWQRVLDSEQCVQCDNNGRHSSNRVALQMNGWLSRYLVAVAESFDTQPAPSTALDQSIIQKAIRESFDGSHPCELPSYAIDTINNFTLHFAQQLKIVLCAVDLEV